MIDVHDIGHERRQQVLIGKRGFGFGIIIAPLLGVRECPPPESTDEMRCKGPEQAFDARPELGHTAGWIDQTGKQPGAGDLEIIADEG